MTEWIEQLMELKRRTDADVLESRMRQDRARIACNFDSYVLDQLQTARKMKAAAFRKPIITMVCDKGWMS